jgi:Integrase core domain
VARTDGACQAQRCRRTGKCRKTYVNLKSAPDEVACAEYVQAKLPACSMNHSLAPEGTKLGELVFSDICGEMPVLGYNQNKYFITFTDTASKTLCVDVLKKKKAEIVLAAFKKVHNIMKNIFSHSIKRLHTDNGREYDNDLMLGYLEDEGIEHTTTAPHQPQSIGIAERLNRTLWERFEPCDCIAILVTKSGLTKYCMLHIYTIEHHH